MRKNINIEIEPCDRCKGLGTTCFQALGVDKIKEVSDFKSGEFYKKGQTIFYEGNHPQGLFCVKDGKIKIHKTGDDGKEQITRFVSSGEFLGYRALLSDETYSASATAIDDTSVCFIPKHIYMELLETEHKFSLNMLKLLSEDLKDSESKMINLLQKPVREKIAEALLILRRSFGFEDDGKTLNVVITRREIGEIAGITTETTIRTLSDFKKERLISFNQKKIVVENLPALIRTAGLVD
ncbi:MAG: Crp/Fnr family transcriptional regulator [Flavobacteriales bacterium]|jgi:CRP/FNR family transcriptional regulator|nr:Crp/Fnr family transcriptional regulator [Flavobacteriales bacterium]